MRFFFYKELINDQVFGVLCESLGNLVNLQTLKLDFNSDDIGNQGIACLQKGMSSLYKLETLCLYFQSNQFLSCEIFEEFIRSLCCFSTLSRLDLMFTCLKVTRELSIAFTELTNRLKCLDYFFLMLFTTIYVPNNGMIDLLNRLNRRYEVEIQTYDEN